MRQELLTYLPASCEKGRHEVRERASCWRSPCENGSVTENRLLPPSRTVFTARARLWGEQLAENRPKCSRSDSAPAFIPFIRLSPLSFIYFRYNRLNADGRTDEWRNEPALFRSPPPAQRDYCVPRSLTVPAAAFWCLLFARVWTANADEQEPRPQNTKLPHNVADNYHDNIHGLKRRERKEKREPERLE